MAKAIRQIRKETPDPNAEKLQALDDILTALAENREAIMTSMGIVNQLHEMGVLNALNGLLQKRVAVGEIAIQQVNQPSMHNTIKNGMNAFKFLGSVNPQHLQTMLDAVSNGLEKSNENINKNEKTSLFKLGNRFRNSDVRASLSTMVGFLEGMGEAFQQDKSQIH